MHKCIICTWRLWTVTLGLAKKQKLAFTLCMTGFLGSVATSTTYTREDIRLGRISLFLFLEVSPKQLQRRQVEINSTIGLVTYCEDLTTTRKAENFRTLNFELNTCNFGLKFGHIWTYFYPRQPKLREDDRDFHYFKRISKIFDM